MAKRENLIGQRFEKWEVIEFSHTDKWGNAHWKCRCECGNIKTVSSHSLKNGNSKSCGCLRIGLKRSPYKARKKQNKGGIYCFQANEIKLKGNYQIEGDRRGGEIKEYKLSPAEFEKYMKELETKEVQYIK